MIAKLKKMRRTANFGLYGSIAVVLLTVILHFSPFHITYQLYGKDRKPLERFLEVLDGEKIPYKVSDMMIRNLPWVKLPTV